MRFQPRLCPGVGSWFEHALALWAWTGHSSEVHFLVRTVKLLTIAASQGCYKSKGKENMQEKALCLL